MGRGGLPGYATEFVPAVTTHLGEKSVAVKALLLLDNATSHPDVATVISKDSNIKALYLPPNTTALFQLMDRGIQDALNTLKKRYCKALQGIAAKVAFGRSRGKVSHPVWETNEHEGCCLHDSCSLRS